ASDRARAAQAAELVARAQAEHGDGGEDDDIEDGDLPYMPSEFPERWSRFLPPDDVKSRLQPSREKEKEPDRTEKPHPPPQGE
ncbi:YihY/virulence factor BrkB family protein, partial [Streptomyces sp. NPDC002530]